MSILKKIIEITSLLVIMLGITIIDLNTYKKVQKQITNSKYEAALNYAKQQENIDKITVVTFDNYMVNKLNENLIEKKKQEYNEYQEYLKTLIVYDGLTMDQLAEKLNRSLKNELSGYGYLYASYTLETGVDPYIAVAISLHETGCNGTCSTLMRECNNVGGQKGSPVCGSGGYRGFATLEDGIKGFIDNLSQNYFGIGLNTPELMNSKYAASTTWATQVNNYVSMIRSR